MENITTIQNDAIRRYFDENSQKWYFSIVDVVGIIAKSTDARNYWKVLKNRLKKAQNKLVTECNQHKMQSVDGKYYLTDTGDKETILQIIEIISKEYLSPFRHYFDNLDQKNSPNISQEPFLRNVLPIARNSYPHLPAMPMAQLLQAGEEMMLLIDSYREKDIFIVQAFVAGVDIENIFISATCKTLTIKGMREKEKNIYVENYNDVIKVDGRTKVITQEQELYWGKFSRSIELPHEIQIDKIEAEEYQGLLTIKLPLIDKLYSKRQKIKSI